MKALLEEARQQAHARQVVKGEWYKVILTPDLHSGDCFNVGIALKEKNSLHSRFLAHFDRLRCLYGNEIEEHTRFLLQILRNHLSDVDSLHSSPSQNIRFEGPFYASGESIDEILGDLFNAIVPIGRAPESSAQRTESAFRSINNTRARILVYEQLDHLMGLNSHRIIAESESLEIRTPQGMRRLDVPLRPSNHYGSIISACYKSRQTIEKYLIKAHLDLQTAQRLNPTNGKNGLFILRPCQDMRLTIGEQEALDSVLDETLWKIRSENYFIGAEDDPAKLAEEVAAWAG
ncbi:MAG: hypothetical protein M0Q95_10895 [Porticoccaceae bacterium]|nr:hypothetical protein [Porticoccaceae bacterium]